MFKFIDIRSYFTFLGRNKGYTAINFFGLSIALAMILLISTYTIRQLSTDAFHEKADRICLFTDGESTYSAYYLQKHLRDRFPEIESTTILAPQTGNVWIGVNKEQFNTRMLFADSTFFRIFSFELVEGNVADFATNSRNVVVSESFARRLMGDSELSIIGQPFLFQDPATVSEPETFTICGVMRDIDNSTIPASDVLVRADILPMMNPSHNERMGNAGAGITALLLTPDCDLPALEEKLLAACKEVYWVYIYGHSERVHLLPLRDHYFSEIATDWFGFNKGNRDFVMVLFSIAFILLFFAVINYINLTMAQTGLRAKEMATRRLLGASTTEVVLRMIAEAVLFALLSAFVALCMAEWAMPLACRLLGYNYSFWSVMNFGYVAAALGFVVLIGVLSGLLPALSISTYKPIDVVKGSFRTRSKMVYSRIFIAVQHTITVIMLIAAATIYLQIRHMITMPLGYNTEDILVVENDMFGDRNEVRRFVDEVKKLPCVEAVGVGNGTPLKGTNNLTFENISFQQIRGDQAYFDMLGLRIKQKSNSMQEAWGFTELTFRTLGVEEDVETIMADKLQYTVGDIYYDFRLFHLYRDQTPAMLAKVDEWPYDQSRPWTTIIKTRGDHAEAVDAIRAMLAETHPNVLWNDENAYLTDMIRSLFEEQERLQKIVTIFTLLAALISALGLLAISTYYIGQCRQEIAIRKVMGATSEEMVRRLIGSFLKMVAVGIAVGLPVAWWLMNRWLQEYTYRISIPLWVFVAAVVVVLLFATVTVFRQSRNAANTNPIDAIKG